MTDPLIEIKEVDNILVVTCTQRRIVDEMMIHDWGQQLSNLVENEKMGRLVLNFSEVEFLSSAALGKLITLEKKVRSQSGALVLCSVHPTIWKAFQMTGLDKKFECFPDEQAALNAL